MSDDLVVDAGPVTAVHRLALAVQVVDATTGQPAAGRLRVSRETARAPSGGPGLIDHGGGRFALTYARADSVDAVVRVADPTRRYVARRLVMALWPLARVVGSDQDPPTAGFVPASSRTLRPWLLPGSAAMLPRGTTALRARVVHGGRPVRWARVEVFTSAGRIGWGHGDERGEVLVVAGDRATYPPLGTAMFPVAVRIHRPGNPPATDPGDPLADLATERIPRPQAPPVPADLDNDRLRGVTPPPTYLTAPDQVITLTAGRITDGGDLTV